MTSDVGALLRAARAARGLSERRHACDLLQRTLLCADPGAVTKAQLEAAKAFVVDSAACEPSRLEVPPHAVLVPLAIESLHTGLVRYMRVALELSSHDGYQLGLHPSAARAVSEALELAAKYVHRTAPGSGYRVATLHPEAFAMLGQDALVDGPSLGAAAFVSAVSLWTERPVQAGTVITGKLVGDAVQAVGAVELKLSAAALCRADIKRILVPTALRVKALQLRPRRGIEVIAVDSLDALVAAALEKEPKRGSAPRHRVAELRRDFEQGWHGFRWETVREHAERLIGDIPDSSVDLRVDVLGMLGATEGNLGFTERSEEFFAQAVALCESEDGKRWVPDGPLSRLYQHVANAHRRAYRLAEARAAAAKALEAAEHGRMRDELFKSYGCVGLAQWSAGDASAACATFEGALAHVHEYAPDSCVRSHGYLIDALALAGDAERVHAEYELATRHLARLSDARRPSFEAWLRTSYGAALFHLGKPRAAAKVFDAPAVHKAIERDPLPGLWARRYWGLSLLQLNRVAQAQELLGPSPFAYGARLGPSLEFSARLNVLCEASGMFAANAWNSDIAGRAAQAMARFPNYLRHSDLEAARAQAQGALDKRKGGRKPGAQAQRALHTLITLGGRIA
jgi:tetratricopeptide (TPR) repeat protein